MLEELLAEPWRSYDEPPESFVRVIETLLDHRDAWRDPRKADEGAAALSAALRREGFEVRFDDDGVGRLTHADGVPLPSANVATVSLSKDQLEIKERVLNYLLSCSEDEFIEKILQPLFLFLGYRSVTPSGHRDKSLEYGRDLWMKFSLPTEHAIYFGLQAKKGTIDSRGRTVNANVAELLNLVKMMAGAEIFDPEINKRRLVDHVIIATSGEITKQAANWLVQQLDRSQRSQLLLLDGNQVSDLCARRRFEPPATLPIAAEEKNNEWGEIPF